MFPEDKNNEEIERLLQEYGSSDDDIKLSGFEPEADALDDPALSGLMEEHTEPERPMPERKSEKKRNVKKVVLITIAVCLALMMLVLCSAVIYINHLMSLMNRPDSSSEPSDGSSLTLPTDETLGTDYTGPTMDVTMPTTPAQVIESDHVINIMLLGEDDKAGYYRGRTDSMILCTINTDKKTLTMTSFLRDLYVTIPGHGDNRLNAAYVFGGFDLFKETMLWNFGVEIDDIVLVEFDVFGKIVDILGGVEISLTQKEVDHLHAEYPDNGWTFVTGTNLLNGKQALAYSRIRKIDSDFNRTKRQQKVLKAIFNAYRTQPLTELLSVTQKVLPYLTVTMSNEDIWSYAYELFPLLSGATIETNRIPAEGTYTSAIVNNMAVLVPDLDANRQVLESIIHP